MPTELKWQPTNAPTASSRTDDIWFLDPQVGWAVNSNGHILKTGDGGATWTRQFAAGAYLRCVAFADPQTGWVGTLTPARRLYRTSDGGATWAPVTGLPANAPVRVCGLAVVNAQVVYAAGSNDPLDPPRMMKTTDGGQTWIAWDMRPHASILIDTFFIDEDHGWVVGGKAPGPSPSDRSELKPVVLSTEDGGRTWVNRLEGQEADFPFGEWGWKIQFLNDRVGFISLENFTDAAILKTADCGRTWARLPITDPQGNANLEGIGFVDEVRGWVGGWGDADFQSGLSSETEDGGQTWQSANEIGKFLNRFRFFGNPVAIGYASGDTVYRYSADPVPAAVAGVGGPPVAERRLLPAERLDVTKFPAEIPVSVPQGTARLTVDLWSRFGRHVGCVFDEARPQDGPRVVGWDGLDAQGRPTADGSYIVRVTADDDAESGLLILRSRPVRSRARSLRWVRHKLPLPATSSLRAISALVAPAPAQEFVDLPDLSGFPSPIEKARFLLHTAAEIEHALLVQYLYAAYSLKRSGLAAPQQAAVTRWAAILRGIAKEEMGHLMTVQNLLLLTRQPLNFEREDFPQPPRLYPFKLQLEPITQRSLAKYVVAESPADSVGIEDIIEQATQGAGSAPNRVGALYTLIGIVFTRAGDLEANAAGGDPWAVLIRDTARLLFEDPDPARRQRPEDWHLPDEAFDAGSLARQATDDEWSPGQEIRVLPAGNREAALAALRDVSVQGEGPTQSSDDPGGSHFQRFLAIYRGDDSTLPFPTGEFQPTLDVPTDPRLDGPDSIADPKARDFARLADLRYALLLGFLEQVYLTEPGNRGFLIDWCFDEMRLLKMLSDLLTGMPRAGQPGLVAALPFTLPDLLHLPEADPAAQWQIHIDRLTAGNTLVDEMLQSHSPGNSRLKQIQADDREKLARAQEARQGLPPTPLGRWEQVRRILNAATGLGSPRHSGEDGPKARFWNLPLAEFLTLEIEFLPIIAPPGPDRGKESNLIKALKGEPPFDDEGHKRMPKGRPPVAPKSIEFIEQWIDDGCPEQ